MISANIFTTIKSLGRWGILWLMIFLSIVLIPGEASGLSSEQRRVMDSGAYYFNVDAASRGSCATTLPGGNNEERVWNYLVGKGMTVVQAAGSMGNLKHEGNFNPKRVEMGHMEGDKWLNENPLQFPNEMDTIPPHNLAPIVSGRYAGQPGYGIVQWTSPGRKQGLQAMADEKGLPVHDLGLQLDFMWSELEGPYKTAALDPLMATDDLAQAVSIWQDHYEVGRGFEPRMEAAQDYLTQYGAGGVTSSPSSSGCSAGLDGVTCPATMQPHPSIEGYFEFPEAPNGEYTKYAAASQYYSSQQLVCVVYSVALAFYQHTGGRTTLDVGEFNGDGHQSHKTGIDVDLRAKGEFSAGAWMMGGSLMDNYSPELTVVLGKLFIDSGQVRRIYWCPPRTACGDGGYPSDNTLQELQAYAQEAGIDGGVQELANHHHHMHIRIKTDYELPQYVPSN